jgi:hypothetical protein
MRLPRCRAVVKWLGVTACLALAAAWAMSGWIGFEAMYCWVGSGRVSPSWTASIGIVAGRSVIEWSGGDLMYYPPESSPPGWTAVWGELPRTDSFGRPTDRSWKWTPERWLDVGGPGAYQGYQYIPLWMPLLVTALPAGWLFHRDRRSVRWSREGRCVGCGYDLSGVSGKCPECGREAA